MYKYQKNGAKILGALVTGSSIGSSLKLRKCKNNMHKTVRIEDTELMIPKK